MLDPREQYKNHSVHNDIENLVVAISNNRVDFQSKDPAQRNAFARFLRAIRFARRRVQNTDPQLVTKTALTSIQSSVNELYGVFHIFLKEKNWDVLARQTDQMLDQLNRLPVLTGDNGISEMAKAISDFRWDAEKELATVKESCEKNINVFQSKIKELSSNIDNLQLRLRDNLQQFEAQKGRLDTLITEETARFSKAEQERSNQVASAENIRHSKMDQILKQVHADLTVLRGDAKKSFEEIAKGYRTTGDDTIDKLKDRLAHAEHIVGLIAGTGMAGHYQKVADLERKSANTFRYLAIGFFILMIGGVWWVVYEIKTPDFSWQVALFRLAVAATLSAPAIYCARESASHRRMEHRNRRIELELASINPYLHELPSEKAQAVIEQLAAHYFGNQTSPDDEGTDAKALLRDITLRGDQVLKLIERLAKIAK